MTAFKCGFCKEEFDDLCPEDDSEHISCILETGECLDYYDHRNEDSVIENILFVFFVCLLVGAFAFLIIAMGISLLKVSL